MAHEHGFDPKAPDAGGADLPELELSDEDILDAMQHISGFLDISTEDFREIYHLAHRHALGRLFGRVRAASLMRVGIEPLRAEMMLDAAAAEMARQRVKGLPVVDAQHRVVGMLTERDFLHSLHAETFSALLLRLLADAQGFTHRCHETTVQAAMAASPMTIGEDAGFLAIIRAFHAHEGRAMPVVDADGRLRGMLLRKDFLHVFQLEDLL